MTRGCQSCTGFIEAKRNNTEWVYCQIKKQTVHISTLHCERSQAYDKTRKNRISNNN